MATSSQTSRSTTSEASLEDTSSSLAYEPEVIKGRNGVKYWKVNKEKGVDVDMCRAILQVASSLRTRMLIIQNEPAHFKFSWESNVKKQSLAWVESIECVDSNKGTAHLMYRHCKWTMSHPSHDRNKNTSTFIKHLDDCIKYKVTIRDAKNGKEQHDAIFSKHAAMTPAKLTEYVLRIIIAGDLSLSFAQNPALRMFLKISHPALPAPTRLGVTKYLMNAASDAKIKLCTEFEKLDSKVSLALDCWNSCNNKDFLGMYLWVCIGCSFDLL
jgi:hypothetical protein